MLFLLAILSGRLWAEDSWWKQAYDRVDFSTPLGLVDSSVIPVVNTCLEPIRIDVDQEHVTGGVQTKGIGWDDGCTLPPFRGQLYNVVVTVPYTLTCGNGVKYAGESRLRPSILLKDGCDHRDRGETYTLHSYPQGNVYVADDGMIRNMWWGDEDGRWREIGVRIGSDAAYFDRNAVKKKFLGATVTLPTFKGGASKLSRPTLFVHGLEVPYTETWGVDAPACNATEKDMDFSKEAQSTLLQSASLTNKQQWSSQKASADYVGSFEYRIKIPAQATCADGSGLNWMSPTISVASYGWTLEQKGKSLESFWTAFHGANPPQLVATSVSFQKVRGQILAWIPEENARKPFSAPFTAMDTSNLDVKWIGSPFNGGVRMRHVVFSFERSLASSEIGGDFTFSPAAFEKALVDTTPDAYKSGTGPDVLSRMQRLKKGQDINKNGIYFFNGYRWNADSGQWMQPKPWWGRAGDRFPGQPGESWSLYQRIAEVLTLHYGAAWETDTSLKIDLVCHSQGGISTREMLANAAGTNPVTGEALPSGARNPANHIRKVVTVNTPHFGSSTVTSLESMQKEYLNSEGRLLKDSADSNITLASVTLSPDLMGRLAQSTAAMAGVSAGTLLWINTLDESVMSDGQQLLALPLDPGPVVGSLVAPMAGLLGLTSQFKADLTGNWLKLTKLRMKIDPPVGDAFEVSAMKNRIDYMYTRMFSGRVKGAHLAVNSPDIERLQLQYPKLPNGTDLQMQTLYSQTEGMGNVIHTLLREQLRGLCDFNSDLQVAQCYGLADLIGMTNYGLYKNIKADLPLMEFLNTWSKEWMAQSDVVVEASSQKAVITGTIWDPKNHQDFFLDPRSYLIRKATTMGRFPDTLVPHGTYSINLEDTLERDLAWNAGKAAGKDAAKEAVRKALKKKLGIELEEDTGAAGPVPQKVGWNFYAKYELRGAPWLGHDIYCALDLGCQDLLAGTGIALPLTDSVANVPLPSGGTATYRTAALQGDFSLGAVTTDTAASSFAVLVPGEQQPRLTVTWSQENGLEVSSPSGVRQMIPAGWNVRPEVERKGETLIVRVKTWGGQTVEETVPLAGAPTTLNLGVLQADTAPVALVGKANPVVKGTKLSIRAWHFEARGADQKYSRPRIVVENNGTETVQGLRVVYVFRADPASERRPVLEAPAGFPGKIERVQGDVWRLVLEDPNVVLGPGGNWPNASVSKIGLRNADWTAWSLLKDPSEDRNWGAPRPNEKIAVYDGKGRLLWGNDLSDGGDDWYPQQPKLTVMTREQAVNELRVTKPEVLLYNQGNTSFHKLKASWFVKLPEGKEPILGDWYTPEARISKRALGNGYWAVDMAFDTFQLYPGKTMSAGQWGLYFNEMLDWDRANDPSHHGKDGEWTVNPWVVVTDSSGKVLWGKLPVFPAPVTEPPQDTVVTPPEPPAVELKLDVELKNEAPWEKNTAKPRVRVWNRGKEKVNRFKLVFPIREVTAQAPDVFYAWPNLPKCSYSVLDKSAGAWDVVADCQETELAPGGVWPTVDGACFGIRKFDWSNWDLSDDPAFSAMGTTFTPAPQVQVLP